MKFCTIIGYPLSNPRSVKLWRNFFKKKKLQIKMSPYEINPIDFKKKLFQLVSKEDFLASAVTMPYKKKILNFVKIKDKFTRYSKAVNFIIKKGKNIYGYNTDVYGALETVKKIKKDKIVIYGFGGAGEPIARTMIKKNLKSKFYIYSKKKLPNDLKSNRVRFLRNKKKIDLLDIDLFINCSPLGSNLNSSYLKKNPLNDLIIKKAKKTMVIFDIVYKPRLTKLGLLAKKNKLKYINGIKMNSIQAEYALKIIEKFINIDAKNKKSIHSR